MYCTLINFYLMWSLEARSIPSQVFLLMGIIHRLRSQAFVLFAKKVGQRIATFCICLAERG